MSKVILRPFKPDTDSGFIYSSYPKGVYHGAYKPITELKSDWFKSFYSTVKAQLERPTNVTIACMQDTPDTILGYIIVQDEVLQFLYVKELFRNQGIASMLAKSHKIKDVANLTKVGHAIMQKHKPLQGESTHEQEPK